ncbi:ABC transporter ATP-binding protein [Salinarimonas rosea]|uniref:ABC transporter ATP-binding protein n=1 Tax=Salinarimonas rosea TaxID=552063 RepID=UPI000405B012|nr:ABC transporter ATP-binding protein [Salinarimonas rosea]
MLWLDAIDVWRGPSQVLRQVSLRVEAGEIVTLLGANGAGKTSTLLTVSGHLRPRAGRARLAAAGREADLARLAPPQIVAAGVAHCPEGRQVFGGMTVLENLRLGAFLRRDGEERADIDRMMGLFPILRERSSGLAGQLSGGEQMMLAMARALMSRPRLLLLDEPSLGLAPQMVERIFDVITRIRDTGTTVLLVEQNAAMALEIADRAYVLESGEIQLSGPAATLVDDPRVQEAYLGVLPAPAEPGPADGRLS